MNPPGVHRYNNLLHQCKANEKCGKLYGLFVAPAFLSSFNAAKMLDYTFEL